MKAGRTHLMDATPVTLGQEFGGYAAQVRMGVERLNATLPRVAELPLGGTAVGTGINAPPGFGGRVIAELASATGLPLTEARDHFEAQGARDALVELSGQLRTIAVSLTKIANDLRWMGSGPRAGLGEINLPDLQPGSSIMPGKVNPVIPEADADGVRPGDRQRRGDRVGRSVGQLRAERDDAAHRPQPARVDPPAAIGRAACWPTDASSGITANVERLREYAEGSPAIVTPLNRYLGYEEAASIAKQALAERKTIREVVVERGHVRDGRLTEARARRGARRHADDAALTCPR